MRVLVFESAFGGHFLHHASLVASALAELGADVVLGLSQEAPASEEYQISIRPLEGRVEIRAEVRTAGHGSTLGLTLERLRSLRTLTAQTKAERVYVPTADGLASLLGALRTVGLAPLPGKVPLELLLMNGSVAHQEQLSPSERQKRRLFHALSLNSADVVFHLNPFVREYDLQRGKAPASAALTIPDPVETPQLLSRAEAREKLGLPTNGRIVGMVGRLDRRKGADVLINGFVHADLAVDDRLLLWGPMSQDVAVQLSALQERPEFRERLLLRDRVLDVETFLCAISALDLVALPYRSTIGSSSIAIRATAAGRPVLMAAGGWGEEVIRRFQLGWVAGDTSEQGLSHALSEYLPLAANFERTKAADRFVAYNTIENYTAHFTRAYRDILGLPQSPALTLWETLQTSTDQ